MIIFQEALGGPVKCFRVRVLSQPLAFEFSVGVLGPASADHSARLLPTPCLECHMSPNLIPVMSLSPLAEERVHWVEHAQQAPQ